MNKKPLLERLERNTQQYELKKITIEKKIRNSLNNFKALLKKECKTKEDISLDDLLLRIEKNNIERRGYISKLRDFINRIKEFSRQEPPDTPGLVYYNKLGYLIIKKMERLLSYFKI